MKTFKEYIENQQILLWLDDERDPDKPFYQREYGARAGMLWVKTVKDAINVLRQGNVAYISFDHDLGTPETGYDLAKWIELRAYENDLPRLEWRVHSDNSIGRQDIIRAMTSAERFWDRNEDI